MSLLQDDIELRERTVRLEQELKHQRELMLESLRQMEQRLAQVDYRLAQMEKRLEQTEKRFEQVQSAVNERSDQLTARVDLAFMLWSSATILSIASLVVALIKLT